MILFSLTFQYCNGGDLADYLNGKLSSLYLIMAHIIFGQFSSFQLSFEQLLTIFVSIFDSVLRQFS